MSYSEKPDKAQSLLLKKRGISPDCVLGICTADMNSLEEYAECWLILTKDELIVASMPHGTGVKTFAGYPKKAMLPEPEPGEMKLERIPIGEITSSGIESMLCCGLFRIERQGENEILCGFTGSFTEGARFFSENLNRFLKGEALEAPKKKEQTLFCPKCGMPYPDPEKKICPKCLDKRSIFIRMLSYFKPHTAKMVAVMLISLVLTALMVILPYVSGTVYFDGALSKNPQFFEAYPFLKDRWLLTLTVVMVTVAVIKLLSSVCSAVQQLMVAKTVPDVVLRIKNDVFSSIRSLSMKFFQNKQTGGLMTRVLSDANEVSGFFIDGLPYLVSNMLTVIAILIIMVIFNWKLAIASVALIPLLIVFIIKLQPRLWHLHGRRHRAARGMNSVLNDSLTGARVIKAFGREKTAETGFKKHNSSVASAEIAIVKYETRYVVALAGVRNIMVLLVWAVGAYLIVSSSGDTISYGMLATFVSYVAMLSGPMEYMVNLFRWWASSMNAAQRIFEIIDSVPDINEPPDAKPLENVRGELEIRNVTFSYESGHPVLKNVSAHIAAGKMLGVVGRSGAGKTTLISLISRLYDPDDGDIFIDGTNIRDVTLPSLRSKVAVVSQESYVFIGTVAQNIAYSRPDASADEIIAAARAASAHDFICKMPDGYDTMVGSGYRQLSGGEKQRLSVARAILADPKILILDEATASVDTETERAIQTALDALCRGRTTVSIAHRLSTLKNADYLVVIDEGRVAESGTHDELMAKKGIYFELCELQRDALLKTAIGAADGGTDKA